MRFLGFVFKFFAALALVAALAGAGVAALTVWYFGRDLPQYQQLADYQPPVATRLYAGDGRLLAEYAGEKRVFVPVRAMPPLVINAFLAAEDHNFLQHRGLDFSAMLRAAVVDLLRAEGRRPIGASTITQQVARNFFLSNEVSLERKVKEGLLAIELERTLSKDRILELYLNQIYLGGGAYGVAEAALSYFNKSLEELSIEEAAFLAALPKAPNRYNPQRYPDAAKTRRDWVIDRMTDVGYITPAQAEQAKAAPVVTRRREATQIVKADYFAEDVRRELLARYGEKALYQDGLAVRTSLDPELQAAADKSLRAGLITYDRRHGWRGPVARLQMTRDWRAQLAQSSVPAGAGEVGWKLAVVLATDADGAAIGFADGARGRIPFDELSWARPALEDQRVGPPPHRAADVAKTGDVVLVEPLSPDASTAVFGLRQIPAVSGALVVLDPHTGRVLALSGGFSYAMGQFDRATQALRQTGSAIKPFVYLGALDLGFTPATLVLDAPIAIDLGAGMPEWEPSNYEHRFFGPTPLRVGIEQSHDLMTVRLGLAIGLDTVIAYVERFGIMDRVPRLYSMLLGAEETTPLRLTTAYAMLVNGGKRITASLIDRVQDRNGATIYRADRRPCKECRDVDWQGQAPPDLPDIRAPMADPRSAFQMVSMLQGVVERGTGHVIAAVGKPLAGKTGTSNGPNDTWFIGFSPDLVAGVFVGFDQPRSLGEHEVGATVAAPIFRDFMADALKDTPAIPFRTPPDVLMVRVNPATGQLARPGDRKAIWEPFKPGTEPDANGNTVVIDGVSGTSMPPGRPTDGVPGAPSSAAPGSGTGGLY
jgi:penicillin-binding protein 1A